MRVGMNVRRLILLSLPIAALAALLASLSLALVHSWAYVHALTHPACPTPAQTPPDFGMDNYREIRYPGHDGLALDAWYVPPYNGVVIVVLPGLGGAQWGMLPEAGVLARHGYGILMTETRSCAQAEGLSTLGYLEARDLAAAVDWVLAQGEVRQVGVLGFSMGGVAAVLGAAADPRIAAVVDEGGFYDLAADISNADLDEPAWVALSHRLNLLTFRWETGVDPRSVSPIDVIDRISPRPLLLVYGEHEVDSGHAWDLFDAAGDPKALWVVPGCGHGGYLPAAPEAWEQRVVGFFSAALLPAPDGFLGGDE